METQNHIAGEGRFSSQRQDNIHKVNSCIAIVFRSESSPSALFTCFIRHHTNNSLEKQWTSAHLPQKGDKDRDRNLPVLRRAVKIDVPFWLCWRWPPHQTQSDGCSFTPRPRSNRLVFNSYQGFHRGHLSWTLPRSSQQSLLCLKGMSWF